MLAGHITHPGRIALVEHPEPTLPAPEAGTPGVIVFEPQLACLCGSDVPFFRDPEGEYPRQIGHSLHEMIGRVVDTNGTRFQAGDRVLAVPVDQVGCFERYLVSEERAIPLDGRATDEQALLAQPLGTVLFALKKLPSLLDQTVAVVGQGPIGQLFVLAIRNLGAREIIAVDPLAGRLEASLLSGATRVVCSSNVDPAEAVLDATDGVGVDVVVEAVGHEEQALNLCIELARPAGRILYFGVPPDELDGVRWMRLFRKNLTVHTSVNPDFRRDFPLAMQWIAEGRVNVDHLVTHRFPFGEIQDAFETFAERRNGAQKVLLRFPAADDA